MWGEVDTVPGRQCMAGGGRDRFRDTTPPLARFIVSTRLSRNSVVTNWRRLSTYIMDVYCANCTIQLIHFLCHKRIPSWKGKCFGDNACFTLPAPSDVNDK